MFDIHKELKNLPEQPGVYIMKDDMEHIIYIGKAKVLKNRVRQYFQSTTNQTLKVQRMMTNVKSFEYIVTSSELEALILECNLIKTHRPKYNIVLKDDKQYPYIKVTVKEEFPTVLLTRNVKKDNAKYYGPFTNIGAVKETLELIQKIFKVRRCNRKLPKDIGKERPCLNHHLGQCLAPCNGNISNEEYKRIIADVICLLDGKIESLVSNLSEQMYAASQELNFEKAAYLRDVIESIKLTVQKQIVSSSNSIDQDVIAFARAFNEALFQIFFIRSGKLIGREQMLITGVENLTRENVISGFIKQFYNGSPTIPKEILLQVTPEDKDIIEQWLSQSKCSKVYITVPQKGEKHKLVDLAAKNASISFEQATERLKREEARTIGALHLIKEALGLSTDIHRIEAYDISNTQGVLSVGSMVVFQDGAPIRSNYRKFKIKEVAGANDYASIQEVVKRRFMHYIKELSENLGDNGKFNKLPDIILMDGGRIQVSAAEQVLNDLNINIPVCGMIKDDFHKTRGLIFQDKEINLPHSSEAFKLITRIQDEVHRFALEYHKKLRSKTLVQSTLDEIKGIGAKRRNNLIKHFGSIDNIKKASLEELQKTEGMNKKTAQAVFSHFHKN